MLLSIPRIGQLDYAAHGAFRDSGGNVAMTPLAMSMRQIIEVRPASS
jgi:hypothetical protein